MIKCLQLWWINPLLTTINPPKTTIYVISNHREFNLDLRCRRVWRVWGDRTLTNDRQPLGSNVRFLIMAYNTTFSVIILYYITGQITYHDLRGVFSFLFVFRNSRPQKSHALNFRSFHQNRWRSKPQIWTQSDQWPMTQWPMCCGINLGLSAYPISRKTPLSFCWFSKPYPPAGSSWWLIELSFQVVSRLHSWIAPGSHASQCYCLSGHLGHYGGGAVPDRSAPAAKIK